MPKNMLPDKLSDCLELALADLAKVERHKSKYVVNMGRWHEHDDGKCSVCLAGSLLAKTMKIPDDVNLDVEGDRVMRFDTAALAELSERG